MAGAALAAPKREYRGRGNDKLSSYIIVLIIVAVAGYAVWVYNRLVGLRKLAQGAWADIDVQLKRRHDLVPNLVSAVKGYAGYERDALQAVVAARGSALAASGPEAAGRAERQLAGAVGQLLLLAESYPELKAAANYLSLQHSLVEIEDHIQQARRYYNAVVRDLNTAMAQFPGNMVAGLFRFGPEQYFGLGDDDERQVPRVGEERK